MNAAAEKILGNLVKKEEKKLITFIKEVDPSIKTKLQDMALGGFGTSKPCLITIELIKDAIEEYKQEKQIYSLEITQTSCTELALSFRKILQISNLENLINVHTLRLDNNMIMKIEGLSKLKNIKWLDLSFNYISEIEGLDDLENLTDLSLYSNQIKEVKNMDKNRKLNVLSVGNNRITDCKIMANYLKRFSNLQALCVHMNPFCKDEESPQKMLEQNQNTHRYPNSYDPLIQLLTNLKYLDWKPINEDYKKEVIQNFQHSGKDDILGNDFVNEEKLMEERARLHKADLDEIIDFFPKVIATIKEEISTGLTWANLVKIPGIEDQIQVCEKAINEDLAKYKVAILEQQNKKDAIIKEKQKQLEKNEEKFIEQSKEMIRKFKRKFKEFVFNLRNGKIKEPVKSPEEAEKYIELEKLKKDLLEIEIYEKQKLQDFIKEFKTAVGVINTAMSERTDTLKQDLDQKRQALKDKITSIVNDLKAQLEQYGDAEGGEKGEDERKEEEEEGGEEQRKNEVLEPLYSIFTLTDFNSDIEKVSEVLDDKISKLKDSLDGARTASTEKYFSDIMTNDYYRNKKRIQDIQEIHTLYYDKIKNELDNLQETQNNPGMNK